MDQNVFKTNFLDFVPSFLFQNIIYIDVILLLLGTLM